MKTFKEKSPIILFGQFLLLDCPLRVFLVGPPNHIFTRVFTHMDTHIDTQNNMMKN
jgi:hypothetical protein